MSESPAEVVTESTEAQPQEGAEEPKVFDAEYVANLRKEAAKYRTEARDATTKLTEIERANETEAQRLQREAQEARDALPKGITEAFREAAVTFGGISAEDAELFLTGSDKETLTKQAARLMERTLAGGPAPDPSQGGSGGAAPAALNSDQLERDLKDKLGIS